MATQDAKTNNFPEQDPQPQQPGQEYIMNPLPQSLNPNYKPSGKLQGKVALITGGDSGIGRSVAYHFSMEGATVAFTYVDGIEDVDKDETLKVIKKLKTIESKDPLAIPADIKYEENCKKVVEQVVSSYGRIDILVNNAAVQYMNNSIADVTTDLLEEMFRTNIYSHFYLIRYALDHMKEGSSIIATASDVAYTGLYFALAYGATKGAIVSFVRSLSHLLLDRKIRVNAVAPGPVWTPLQVSKGSIPPESIPTFGQETPMKRAAQPWEMAPSYVFLASDDCSSYYTGQVLHPNGGAIINC